ncbi:MAG: hypothetical protein HP002_05440 [Lentisphaeria bacterium]|nr:hypothetical protein [Lentisphaeria bacterium]
MEKNERSSGLPLPAGKRRKVRVWLIVPAAVAGVVALTAFLILGMPRDYRKEVMNETPDPGLFLSIQQKLADAMLTPDGVAEQAEIALTAEELNACLNAGLKMAQLKPKEGDPSFNGSWRDGLLELRVSQPLVFLAVNAELRATPGVRDGKPELTVHSARAGWLPLPAFALEGAADRVLAELAETEDFKIVLAAVESVSPSPSGGLKLVVNPPQISRAILYFLSRSSKR